MNISKLANGFFEEAEATSDIGGAAKRAISRYKNKHKGLWVGGKVTISNGAVAFVTNGLNRALHEELSEINIPTKEIQSVAYEFGWFTGIVVVTHTHGEFRFRCYGAKKLANKINFYVKGL